MQAFGFCQIHPPAQVQYKGSGDHQFGGFHVIVVIAFEEQFEHDRGTDAGEYR
jgi:hypothetical protein